MSEHSFFPDVDTCNFSDSWWLQRLDVAAGEDECSSTADSREERGPASSGATAETLPTTAGIGGCRAVDCRAAHLTAFVTLSELLAGKSEPVGSSGKTAEG